MSALSRWLALSDPGLGGVVAQSHAKTQSMLNKGEVTDPPLPGYFYLTSKKLYYYSRYCATLRLSFFRLLLKLRLL